MNALCMAIGLATAIATAELPTASEPARLRVLSIQPRCFEFKFMSYMLGGGGRHRLVFNDLEGATHVVQEGEWLGEYTVTNFQPRVVRTFNRTISAEQETKSGVVSLRPKGGEELVLTLGEPLTVEGWMACLVDVASGDWQFVRAGDRVATAHDKVLRVSEITAERVVLVDGQTASSPDWLSEGEHEELAGLWAQRDRARRQAAAAAAPADAPDPLRFAAPLRQPAPPPPRREIVVSRSPRLMFGTDYPCPTAFEVIPVPVRTATGSIVYRGLTVPVRFERRMSSHGISTR